jgi:cytochrome c-type biogenesis protein CcmH/NrfG
MELNRPAEAVPLLDRLLAKDTSSVEARMLLARAHVALANYEEALDQYGRIAASNVSAEIKKQAQDNAREIEGRITGGTRK